MWPNTFLCWCLVHKLTCEVVIIKIFTFVPLTFLGAITSIIMAPFNNSFTGSRYTGIWVADMEGFWAISTLVSWRRMEEGGKGKESEWEVWRGEMEEEKREGGETEGREERRRELGESEEREHDSEINWQAEWAYLVVRLAQFYMYPTMHFGPAPALRANITSLASSAYHQCVAFN